MSGPYRTAAKIEPDPPIDVVPDSDAEFEVGGLVAAAADRDDRPSPNVGRGRFVVASGLTAIALVAGVAIGMGAFRIDAGVARAADAGASVPSSAAAARSPVDDERPLDIRADPRAKWRIDVEPQLERERERERLKNRAARGLATTAELAELRRLCRETGDPCGSQ